MAWESRVQKKNSWNAPPTEKSIFPKKRGWSNPENTTNDTGAALLGRRNVASIFKK